MAGFRFTITTERPGGGAPMIEWFDVGAADEVTAAQRLRDANIVVNEKATVIRQLTDDEIKGLNLLDGQIQSVRHD